MMQRLRQAIQGASARISARMIARRVLWGVPVLCVVVVVSFSVLRFAPGAAPPP